MKNISSIFITIIVVIILLTTGISAKFIDISEWDYGYTAIQLLNTNGILRGYEDGSYRPNGFLTRAEAAAVITRADGSSPDASAPVKSGYQDVADTHWGAGYIMRATESGIINGMGNGYFSPESKVTYSQWIKMIVCMNSLEARAVYLGGWPNGYISVAYERGYINQALYTSLIETEFGKMPITRREVAILVNRAMNDPVGLDIGTDELDEPVPEAAITVDGRSYTIGMSSKSLGAPDETAESGFGWKWYFYGTGDYTDFLALGVQDGTVVAFQSAGVGFEYLGKRPGDETPQVRVSEYKILTVGDANDKNRFHAVFVYDKASSVMTYTDTAIAGESRLNFHLTNAFRVYHGLRPFIWDQTAALVASRHSADLAKNDYFSHTSLNGTTFSQRLTAQGLNWQKCAENLFGGSVSGFDAYYRLVNSAGHRTNLLGDYLRLGVGMAYQAKSTYQCYLTQEFITLYDQTAKDIDKDYQTGRGLQ